MNHYVAHLKHILLKINYISVKKENKIFAVVSDIFSQHKENFFYSVYKITMNH